MAAPILWAPGIFGLFLQDKNSMSIKFLVSGVWYLVFLGGGSVNFVFMGAGIFVILDYTMIKALAVINLFVFQYFSQEKKKAHTHKLFALVRVRLTLEHPAG